MARRGAEAEARARHAAGGSGPRPCRRWRRRGIYACCGSFDSGGPELPERGKGGGDAARGGWTDGGGAVPSPTQRCSTRQGAEGESSAGAPCSRGFGSGATARVRRRTPWSSASLRCKAECNPLLAVVRLSSTSMLLSTPWPSTSTSMLLPSGYPRFGGATVQDDDVVLLLFDCCHCHQRFKSQDRACVF